MAASAPSFSSCDVVPQQRYRRSAEESPAVAAPSHSQPAELWRRRRGRTGPPVATLVPGSLSRHEALEQAFIRSLYTVTRNRLKSHTQVQE